MCEIKILHSHLPTKSFWVMGFPLSCRRLNGPPIARVPTDGSCFRQHLTYSSTMGNIGQGKEVLRNSMVDTCEIQGDDSFLLCRPNCHDTAAPFVMSVLLNNSRYDSSEPSEEQNIGQDVQTFIPLIYKGFC